jgi:hypothetical protein
MSPEFARLRVALRDTAPTVWRRIEVPLTASLYGLHEAIQAALLFLNYHLFEFRIGDKSYGIPDPDGDEFETLNAKSVKLAQLVERGVRDFSYAYDFGDGWEFDVTIEAVAAEEPGVAYPRFLDGARRAPPEDVGGIPGFEHFLAAMAEPRHRDRKRLIEWYGSSFEPDDIGRSEIEAGMERLARRRAAGKAGFLKSQGLKRWTRRPT